MKPGSVFALGAPFDANGKFMAQSYGETDRQKDQGWLPCDPLHGFHG